MLIKDAHMLFLSAQPDDYYFLWQLELQLFNFKSVGIKAEQIHVLIGYNPEKGLQQEFITLMQENNDAVFFAYPDNRTERSYPSSIRPHLIKQHVSRFPHLVAATIFYHDSDILFRELPDFSGMLQNDYWYVSDTRSYLDSEYIRSSAGEAMFLEMCEAAGVSPETVRDNDCHAGGAQYLVKHAGPLFWDKVERDCETLYGILTRHYWRQSEQFYLSTGNRRSAYKGIQAWCADMWAVFYNALYFNFPVRIHPELDFCWPKEPVLQWHRKKILHYAGVDKREQEQLFCKGAYINYPPYFELFDHIDLQRCSAPIVELIGNYRSEKSKRRTDLRNVTFLLQARPDAPETLVRYLTKHFDTHIQVTAGNALPAKDGLKVPDTPLLAVCDADVVLETGQYEAAAQLIHTGAAERVIIGGDTVVCADSLFTAMFGKLLDAGLFLQHIGKLRVSAEGAAGVVFMSRAVYEATGGQPVEDCITQRLQGPVFRLKAAGTKQVVQPPACNHTDVNALERNYPI